LLLLGQHTLYPEHQPQRYSEAVITPGPVQPCSRDWTYPTLETITTAGPLVFSDGYKAPYDAHSNPYSYANATERPNFQIIFKNPGISFALISLNSYQKKRRTEIALRRIVQTGPGRAWSGRMDPGAVSSNCILAGCRPFAGLGLALDGPFAGGVRVGADAGAAESVRDTGLARLRRGLGHRPYRLVRRTPVLYSRNQSRTNIVPFKEKREEGRGKLAELLKMS